MEKINKRNALVGSSQTRNSQVRVAQIDNNDNTLSFTFISSENSGERYDWGTGEYYEEFLDVSGANTASLNTFFKDHSRSVDSASGKIVNKRIVNNELVGDVIFGSDDESQVLMSKYREGILTDVSVGYRINDYKVDKGCATNGRDLVTVTNYDVFEVSAVGIGFDSGATKRENNRSSQMDEKMKERLAQLEAMAKVTADEEAELKKLKMQEREAENKRLKDENLEFKRVADIQAVLREYPSILDDETTNSFIEDKTKTVSQLRSALLAAKVKDTPVTTGSLSVEKNDGSDLERTLADALALRLGAKLSNPNADAYKYRTAPLATIANLLLPEDQRSFNPLEIAERAMVTGDFPNLLLNAGNRVLESEFDAQIATAKAWVKEVDVNDFRENVDIIKGIGGRLSRTKENGDLQELSIDEAAESWKLESFGNKFVLTREMIINDDLGAFTDMLTTFAQMAATTVNGLVYDLLRVSGEYAGYKMKDGTSLYSAAHGNKLSLDLSSDALTKARMSLRKQKGIDKKTPLNIVPKYLIVGVALEQTAKELLNSSAKIDANNSGVVNVHQNSLELIVDAELNDTEWYVAADRRTIKVGYLSGTGRRPVVKMDNSSLIRTTFEGVFDLGLVAEDYRGLVQGNQ